MAKKKVVFVWCLILTAVMIFSMTGCGGSGNEATEESTTAVGTTGGDSAATAASTSGSDASGLPIVKDKITLRILSEGADRYTMGNDMPVIKELENRTNIHLEWELLPVTNPLEKFNLIMASGDLPDIVGFSANQDAITKFGMQGAFVPLQDLIKTEGPDIQKAIENPLFGDKLPYTLNIWAELTVGDGNVYTVPVIASTNSTGPLYGIRTDWLEKLGLAVPETPDQLYDVLKAFRDKDPNGNQKKDELPFIAGQGRKTPSVLELVNAFDGHMDLYIDKDGKVQYGPAEASFKEGLAYLNKLYKEGLLESDYLTSTRDQWLAKTTGSLAGFMYINPASGFATVNTALVQVNPQYKLDPILPLKSSTGARFKDGFTAWKFLGYRTSITKSNKYPTETMKLLNYLFTEEGGLLAAYGIDGLDYTLVDGKPVYTDHIINNPDGIDPENARIMDGMYWLGLPYQIGWDPDFQAMQKNAPQTVKGWELYREPGVVEAPFPTLQLSEADLSLKNQYVTEINTYKDPMIDKFIMGVESLDKFDEFVNGINKSGLQDLLKILNTSYDNYKKLGAQ